jgi:hypothetical protein
MITVQTVLAAITWNMMGDKDPITNLITIYAASDLNNLPPCLMTEHPGSFLNPIPLHDIATADATGQHFHQKFTRTD